MDAKISSTIIIDRDIYQKEMDDIEELSIHLVKLCAMLQIIHGNGDLSIWSPDIQDNYLWACSTMADQAHNMAEQINSNGFR